MNEDALRALVRETIARLDSRATTPPHHHDHRLHEPVPVLMHFSSHPSHYRYAMQPGSGPCQIEPHVKCEHCGYCESHGH